VEAALKDGDILQNAAGQFQMLDGINALFQRAAFRLNVKKGAFWYAPEFGSHLFELDRSAPESENIALSMAAEALLPMPEAKVISAEIYEDRISFIVEIFNERRKIEVKYS